MNNYLNTFFFLRKLMHYHRKFFQCYNSKKNFLPINLSIAFDGRVSQVLSTTNLPDSTLSDNFVYIYDMVGNLETKTGTAGETTFAYDENGRMLSQGDASARLDYVYGPGSYAVSRATGRTPMDGDRDASRTGNFQYDASGRMVFDSSRSLSVTYDMEGLPAVFLQDSGSGTWRELAVYDPSGWRVAAYSYENGALVSLRTDIMLDGRKELERRTAFAGSDSSTAEYAMLYGSGGALGRRHADGTYEWYVKDRQGSLVMSVVDGGVGSALVYEPFGFQRLLRVSGDVPAEQYTGKEYDGRLGLTYFGARYFDPSFALWLTPDPAGQYLNPYSYGGDPVNFIDGDGRWGIFSAFVPVVSIVSAIYSASNSSESVGEWFAAAAIDYFGNNVASTAEPAVSGISLVWGAISTVAALGQAVFGDGEWNNVMKPLLVSGTSSFMSDINSGSNAIMAAYRGDIGEIFTNLAASGTNGLATDYYAFQYSTNKGFGSQEYTYEGSYAGSGGHRNIIWGQKTNEPHANARNFGQNIVLFKDYYRYGDERKQAILRHEFVHARQESKYGVGGVSIRLLYRSKKRPADDAIDDGMFGYSCEEVKLALQTYCGDCSELNLADLEAELNENAGENSEYWFDAPVFY